MSVPFEYAVHVVSRWWDRVRTELTELRTDIAALCQHQWQRVRADPAYRTALARALLRSVLTALGRGPRATVLWMVALVLEVLLEALRVLQGDDEPWGGPAYA